MHILITDSGVGGLSVVAYAERFVRTRGVAEPVQLTFANAAPENDYGYNSMATRDEKLQTFDRFLRNVTRRFAPDLIYVACNTLSVLLPDTPYMSEPEVPVRGIVETGVELLFRELQRDPRSAAIVFGTVTTIEAGAYPRLLAEGGIDPARIVSQACPGLADTISEDREGSRTAAEIGSWVDAALAKLPQPHVPVVAALACTHYGYRGDTFAAAFGDRGATATVINPNERAVYDLFDPRSQGGHRGAEVRVVTRYPIPEAAVEALRVFLGPISPGTVTALRDFTHAPDLF